MGSLASPVDIVINIQPERKMFRNALDSLNRFLHLHNMPHDNPQLCIQVREYFQLSMHLHRERANASLYELMSPKLQGTIVRQIPMHSKWMSALESILNKGRTGLFRSGDAIRIEPPDAARGGRNLITHVPTGMQVERQDFNASLTTPVTMFLKLTEAESNVGASITVKLDGSLRSADPPPTRIPAKSGEINRLVWLMYRG